MKLFSEISNGKMAIKTIPNVSGTWLWHFTYYANADPNTDITNAGGLIDPDERNDGLFSGRVFSAHHDTFDDLKAVQVGLGRMGWTQKA